MTPIIIPQFVDDQPSWCERHDCQCPCHDEPPPWYEIPLLVVIVLSLVLGGAFALITLLEWSTGNDTLLKVLINEWRFVTSLLHRIW